MARSSRLPIAGGPRRIPWQMVLTVGMRVAQEGRKRWSRLTPREQRHLVETLKKARGGRGAVPTHERAELRRIVWKAVGPDR